MTPLEIRSGLRVAMRVQRDLTPTDKRALQSLIAVGILVLRATDAAADPVHTADTVPGDYRPTLYRPMDTRRLAL